MHDRVVQQDVAWAATPSRSASCTFLAPSLLAERQQLTAAPRRLRSTRATRWLSRPRRPPARCVAIIAPRAQTVAAGVLGPRAPARDKARRVTMIARDLMGPPSAQGKQASSLARSLDEEYHNPLDSWSTRCAGRRGQGMPHVPPRAACLSATRAPSPTRPPCSCSRRAQGPAALPGALHRHVRLQGCSAARRHRLWHRLVGRLAHPEAGAL